MPSAPGEKDPQVAPWPTTAPPLVQALRPVDATGSPAIDPRLAQQSWPGHVVLLRPCVPWPPQVPVPRLLNPANSQQNADAMVDVAAADVNPAIDSCDENMLPKVNMLFDGESDAYDFYNAYAEKFERILCDRQSAELEADVNANQSTKKPPSMRMLRQAANAYTPAAFKMFEREFELYMDCMLYSCGEIGTIFDIAAARAATSTESFTYMENQSNIFMDQVEQVIQTRPPDIADLIGANCDRTQSSVENIVAEGIHSHTNFLNGSADDSLTFPFTLGAGALDYR
ncbi:hypothetical protein BAE44_0011879 [Dichanthelium oligosanthes]|uniref:Protein FAR1-RELATED SEQUENCE n=1 Tax=Dichanthelium oligosanthes TaxID=888268 RepID=A0A1E5VPN9_9POAL|nr:hypothetical protein BAE44_0011879 [Dichanthelium oligosanthes]